jgi:hypothetical protein
MEKSTMNERETMRKQNRCQARTKAGKPCRAAATEGGLCFFHANPNKAVELGRIGGRRSKRQAATASADPLPALNNAMAVGETLNRWIAEVYSGKLDFRVAAVLVRLLDLQVRVTPQTDLEQRIAKLEEQRLADAKTKAEPEAEPMASFDGDQDTAALSSGNLATPQGIQA